MTENHSSMEAENAYRHADAVTDQALEWFGRLNGGIETVDARLRAEFEAWLAAANAHHAAWREVNALWSDPETLVASQQISMQHTAQIVPLAEARRRRPWTRYGLALAATLLLSIAVSHVAGPLLSRWQADYATGVGETRSVTLPDGSLMMLNTYSAVELAFKGDKRGVKLLQGEVWFDVVEDASRPFHVAGQFSDVVVKGTTFAVKRQNGADMIALQDGIVEARHDDPAIAPVRLAPGEMVLASSTALSSISRFDGDETLGWLDGRIVISEKPLGEALDEIDAYLHGRVVVMNRDLLSVAVSGNFRTDSAGSAIASLVAAAGGQTTRLPGGIIIIR